MEADDDDIISMSRSQAIKVKVCDKKLQTFSILFPLAKRKKKQKKKFGNELSRKFLFFVREKIIANLSHKIALEASFVSGLMGIFKFKLNKCFPRGVLLLLKFRHSNDWRGKYRKWPTMVHFVLYKRKIFFLLVAKGCC
jgi:hypothetical protein